MNGNDKDIKPIVMIAMQDENKCGVMINMDNCPVKNNGVPLMEDLLYELIKGDPVFGTCCLSAAERVEAEMDRAMMENIKYEPSKQNKNKLNS